jgi:hypothetical protein
MAKKETINNYPIEDLESMYKLFRHVGPFRDTEQNLIYEMLRRYIDPAHPRPISGCNCSMSYANAFNKLRDWVGKNGDKFS